MRFSESVLLFSLINTKKYTFSLLNLIYSNFSHKHSNKNPPSFCPSSKTPADYEYLRYSQPTAPGIDDDQQWRETEDAFCNVGFSDDSLKDIMQICTGILEMGNVTFKADKSGEGSVVNNEDCLLKAAQLMGRIFSDSNTYYSLF